MKKFICIFGMLICGVMQPCIAQTTSQAALKNGAIDGYSADLRVININLLEMAIGSSGNDVVVANGVSDCAGEAVAATDLANAYLSMYSLMVDGRDQATIKKFIPISSKNASKLIDACNSLTNKLLPKTKSQALIAEIQKARDLLSKIKSELP
jgi:hypothetical protein